MNNPFKNGNDQQFAISTEDQQVNNFSRTSSPQKNHMS